MPRRFVQAMYLLAIGIVLFVGISIYRSSQNTAQHAGEVFVRKLIAGDTNAVAAQATDNLRTKHATNDQLMQTLRGYSGTVQIISKEPFYDTFNTYPTGSMPTRLVYDVQLNGKKYWITVVTYEEEGSWKVDSVSGSYVQ